jgi:hypothetical protein
MMIVELLLLLSSISTTGVSGFFASRLPNGLHKQQSALFLLIPNHHDAAESTKTRLSYSTQQLNNGDFVGWNVAAHDYLTTSSVSSPSSSSTQNYNDVVGADSLYMLTTEMIPIATDPLLCVSSQPILSKDECDCLLEWCKQVDTRYQSLTVGLQKEQVDDNGQPASRGAKVLWKVQQWVHGQLLDSTDEETIVVPRFVYYPNGNLNVSEPITAANLLPAGLHVDTNGNQQLRHWYVPSAWENVSHMSDIIVFPTTTSL